MAKKFSDLQARFLASMSPEERVKHEKKISEMIAEMQREELACSYAETAEERRKEIGPLMEAGLEVLGKEGVPNKGCCGRSGGCGSETEEDRTHEYGIGGSAFPAPHCEDGGASGGIYGDPHKKPKPLFFEDFRVGQTFNGSGKDPGTDEHRLRARMVREEDIQQFAALTGDTNPLHCDNDFAKQAGFRGIIAHGLMEMAWVTGMVSEAGIWDETLTSFLGGGFDFKNPVYPGDILLPELSVLEKRDVKRYADKRGLVKFAFLLRKHESDEIVCDGFLTVLIMKKPVRPA